MSLRKNGLLAVFVLGGALLSAQASAQAYLGGEIGTSKWNLDCTGTTSCHSTAAAYKFFGGYDVTSNFGVEGSYAYLNEVHGGVDGLNVSFNARGADIAAVGKLAPIKGFVGFAKAGLAYMKGEVVATVGTLQGSDHNYSAQPLVGFGVIYAIDPKVSLRLQLDQTRVKVSGIISGTTSNVTTLSFGIQSQF